MDLHFQELLDMDTDAESWWTYGAMIANMTLPVKLSYTFQQLTDAHMERVIRETFQKNARIELDLTGNRITDVGAAFLAQALQQNQVSRSARYLEMFSRSVVYNHRHCSVIHTARD
ncbi:unnamed protein product [Rotaria socialis]|uniref:Uncharacterized protein n=1 Tax=Rotaria socialis TaxID=392032 RepID=A0A821ZWQ8_9BILA|nr:unnamed protein product [Rotaria socialis]